VIGIGGEGGEPVVYGDEREFALGVEVEPVAVVLAQEGDEADFGGGDPGGGIGAILEEDLAGLLAQGAHVFFHDGVEGGGIGLGVDAGNDEHAGGGEGGFEAGLVPDVGEAGDDDVADAGKIGWDAVPGELGLVVLDMDDGVQQPILPGGEAGEEADGLQALVVKPPALLPVGMDQDRPARGMQPDAGGVLVIDIDKRAFLIRDDFVIAIAEGEVVEAEFFQGDRKEFLPVVGLGKKGGCCGIGRLNSLPHDVVGLGVEDGAVDGYFAGELDELAGQGVVGAEGDETLHAFGIGYRVGVEEIQKRGVGEGVVFGRGVQSSKFKIQSSKFKVQNSKSKRKSKCKVKVKKKNEIQNSKFKIQNSNVKIQNVKDQSPKPARTINSVCR